MKLITWCCWAQAKAPRNISHIRLRAILPFSLILFGLGGCATYSSSFNVIERNLAAQQYDAALAAIEKDSASNNEKVLYLLNKGMVLRMKRDFVASNVAFEAAKTEMDRLYAASVSENALSVMVNDSSVSYSGDNYERVLLHLYMALNYLELGETDSARVEALQIDAKLREFAENIPDSKYAEDAFTLYLTGLIYEDGAEWSDAMISYRSAYEVYKKYQSNYGIPVPAALKLDLLRLSKRLGLIDEREKYKLEFGVDAIVASGASAKHGELVFVLNTGLVPIKREKSITTFDPKSGGMVRVSLPVYESRANNISAARITVNDNQAMTDLVENIDVISKKNLDEHMPAIIARSVARNVIKAAASRRARELAGNNRNNDNAMVGILGALALQVAAVASETADTRSWLTLPGNILMARMALPPGTYDLKVELLDLNNQVVATQTYPGLSVQKSRKTFLTQHWVPNQISLGGR